jgi:hypothetical protein
MPESQHGTSEARAQQPEVSIRRKRCMGADLSRRCAQLAAQRPISLRPTTARFAMGLRGLPHHTPGT